MKYCLIGEKLPHSYSADIHSALGLDYCLKEIKSENLDEFFSENLYDGFNVTIPYKKAVIKYLSVLDDSAAEVGAVNTVAKRGGRLVGYNTDIDGMKYLISRVGYSLKGKTVAILGSGGTSLTARALCKREGAGKVYVISRNGDYNYENCYSLDDVQVIINCTPVGTFPNVFDKPVKIGRFCSVEAVFDCVYNPKRTALLKEAESLGLTFCGGLPMLVKQAVSAEEIWLNKKIGDEVVERLIDEIDRKTVNVVFSGMPSSGKSTIGKAFSKLTGREFIDTDALISQQTGRTPEEIILQDGEAAFREIESQVVKEASVSCGKVISLGGGALLNPENADILKNNGKIYYIKRDVSLLIDDGRPLSKKEGLKTLFEKRKKIYEGTCDFSIENDGEIEKAVKEILDIYENTRY